VNLFLVLLLTMENFLIKIVREPGPSGVGSEWMPYGEEYITVKAENEDKAFRLSHMHSKLPFRGQLRRTFINGIEYSDPRY
jgi:hypothetical protein